MKKLLAFFAALFLGFSLSFGQVVPVTASAQTGKQVTFTITASGSTPFTYVWSKDGATFTNPGTDQSVYVIAAATASSAGVYKVIVSNSAGSTTTPTATLTITVPAPVLNVTGVTATTVAIGASVSYQVVASNSPTSYGATGLPPGLAINATTGMLTGSPTTPGVYTITLSATNAGGTGTAVIVITVPGVAPTITGFGVTVK